MTMPAVAIITLVLIGVLTIFWWLVELTGGLAGRAFSVGRSIQGGVVSWFESRDEPPSEADGPSESGGSPVPMEKVIVRGKAPVTWKSRTTLIVPPRAVQ